MINHHEKTSAVPTFVLKAGMVAAATAISAPTSQDCTLVPENISLRCATVNHDTGIDDVVAAIRSQIRESWDEKVHAPELRKLIVNHAVMGDKFPAESRIRMRILQGMKRETLPLPTSYEEFIRERDRIAELKRLTDHLAEYKRKYDSIRHA